MLDTCEPCPSSERDQAMMACGSDALLHAINVSHDQEWPCGHARSYRTTQTVAGVHRCRECRRARWDHGFRVSLARIRMREAKREKDRTRYAEQRDAIRASIKARRLPLDIILGSVAESFDLTVRELLGKSRATDVVNARSVVAHILRDRGLSYDRIGKLLGDRDHSTIINALSKFDIYTRRDPRVSDAYLLNWDLAA